MLDSTPVHIRILKLSTFEPEQYSAGRLLGAAGAAGMGSDADAASRQVDSFA